MVWSFNRQYRRTSAVTAMFRYSIPLNAEVSRRRTSFPVKLQLFSVAIPTSTEVFCYRTVKSSTVITVVVECVPTSTEVFQ